MEPQQNSDAAVQPTKARGRPFEHGQSGNPSGRPKGARNKTTIAVEALLDNEAEALTWGEREKKDEGSSKDFGRTKPSDLFQRKSKGWFVRSGVGGP
jgi:hypothetical protein